MTVPPFCRQKSNSQHLQVMIRDVEDLSLGLSKIIRVSDLGSDSFVVRGTTDFLTTFWCHKSLQLLFLPTMKRLIHHDQSQGWGKHISLLYGYTTMPWLEKYIKNQNVPILSFSSNDGMGHGEEPLLHAPPSVYLTYYNYDSQFLASPVKVLKWKMMSKCNRNIGPSRSILWTLTTNASPGPQAMVFHIPFHLRTLTAGGDWTWDLSHAKQVLYRWTAALPKGA